MTITIPFNDYANDFIAILDQDNCVFLAHPCNLMKPNAIGVIIGNALLRASRIYVPDKFVI